jgi:hypothetical protein
MYSIRSAFVATSFALAVCAIAPPGDASPFYQTGYGAFRPLPSASSQTCVVESSGGALNDCSSTTPPVSLTFDLTTDVTTPNPVIWNIRASSFGSASAAMTCRAMAVNQLGTTPPTLGGQQTFAASGIEIKTFGVSVPPNHSLRFQCTGVPRNKGILALYWFPVAAS